MLSTRLEKAILAGWATYRTVNHAFGSFGSVTIPKDHLAIVTSVKWNHFMNPITDRLDTLKWSDLFKYCEYQLKIDGNKSVNFLQFRNIFEFRFSDPSISFNMTENVNVDTVKKYLVPINNNPIQQDVYFVCEKFINISITRNTYINNISTDFQNLNPVAAQKDAPVGLANQNVLTTANMASSTGDKMTYSPVLYPNAKPVGVTIEPQNMETYTQPISKDSLLQNPKGDNNPLIYYQYPLIELGVVVFNKNYQDKIMNG